MRIIGVDESKIYNEVEGIEHHLSWEAIDRIGDLVQYFEQDEVRVETLRGVQKQMKRKVIKGNVCRFLFISIEKDGRIMKAIIFDFDGLIVDTETIWFHSFRDAVREYGGDLPLEEFAKCIGTTDDVLYAYLNDQLKEKFNKHALKEKVKTLHKEKMKITEARDGVKEYLQEAKEMGLKIALASSSSREWVIPFWKSYKFEIILKSLKREKMLRR